MKDHLVHIEHKGQCEGVHDQVHDASGLHQVVDTRLGQCEPQRKLREKDEEKVKHLPVDRNPSHPKLHKVKLGPSLDPLHILLARPLWNGVRDPTVCTSWHFPERPCELKGVVQVLYDGQHEDKDAGETTGVVLQAILSGIYVLIDLLGVLREDRLHAVSHENPGAPDRKGIEPRRGVNGARRAHAIGGIGACLDRSSEVAKVHLPCEGVHDELLLSNHRKQEALDQEV
mmetsp:Transcript_91684/g.218429  ORF Transcript_91684/g.218429 Transcript_91684/m.218429 type:complete len:229 (-) Transcript_91684:332-1018(-)